MGHRQWFAGRTVLAARLRPALLAACCAAVAQAAPASAPLLWRMDLGRAVARSLACDDTSAFAVTTAGRGARLALSDGRGLWRAREWEAMTGGLTLAAGRVLGLGDEPDGRLGCLDAATGDRLWSAEVGPGTAAPIVHGSLVLCGGLRGKVSACDLHSGEIVWQRPVPGAVRAPLAVAGEMLLVPTVGDTLIGLHVQSGDRAWGAAPGGALYGAPLARGGRAWTLSYPGDLICWDAATGRQVRRARLEGPFRCGPAAAGDAIVALSAGGTAALLDSSSLAVRWQVNLAAAATLDPLVDGDRVWLALGDRTLRALALDDGRELARYSLSRVPSAGPLRAGRVLLLGLGSGDVVAFDVGGESPVRPSGPGGGAALPFWQRALGPDPSAGPPPDRQAAGDFLASPAAGGPSVVAAVPGSGPRLTGAARWWGAGWLAGTGLALWLQHDAEQAHERYETTGDPHEREAEFDRAQRLDRAVLGTWIAAEAMFVLMLRSWLRGGA